MGGGKSPIGVGSNKDDEEASFRFSNRRGSETEARKLSEGKVLGPQFGGSATTSLAAWLNRNAPGQRRRGIGSTSDADLLDNVAKDTPSGLGVPVITKSLDKHKNAADMQQQIGFNTGGFSGFSFT